MQLGFVLFSFCLKGGILIVTTPGPQQQAAVAVHFPNGRDKRGSMSCCYNMRERFPEYHVNEIKINTNTEQNPSLKEGDDLKLLVIKGETALHIALL